MTSSRAPSLTEFRANTQRQHTLSETLNTLKKIHRQTLETSYNMERRRPLVHTTGPFITNIPEQRGTTRTILIQLVSRELSVRHPRGVPVLRRLPSSKGQLKQAMLHTLRYLVHRQEEGWVPGS